MANTRHDSALADADVSAADLTDKEFYLAKRTSSGYNLAGDEEIFAGVITEGRAAGKSTSVSRGPVIKAIAIAAIAKGVRVTCGAGGKVKAGTTNAFGTSRNSTAAANELLEIDVD